MSKITLLTVFVFIFTGILSGCAAVQPTLPIARNEPFDLSKISDTSVNASTGFAFDIFRQVNAEDEDSNVFISPFSIAAALTMTYQGAGTTTREAMAEALNYTGIDIEIINESYKNLVRYLTNPQEGVTLSINNSVWFREGEPIKEDFLNVNREVFDAFISELDFSREDAADQINRWISDATNNKIEHMVDSPISSQVVMFLINAIYFKGEWTNQFDKKLTVSAPFHAGDGTVQDAMMMSKTGTVEYGQGDGFKAVRLPYGDGNMAFYCILPDEGASVNDFIKGLDYERFEEIRDSISEVENVRLQLPRFKLEYGIKNLNNSLIALGMGEAFSAGADFSGIREEIFISDVLHKALIEVNEEGSEAAAVTAVGVMIVSIELEPVTFIADRPFVFIIADKQTDTVLFIGKLNNL